MNYEHAYREDSDTGDDYGRSNRTSPTLPVDYESSPTESAPSNENTPTSYSHFGGAHPSPRGSIIQWTSQQCADYVSALGHGLNQYAGSMIDEAIDGASLVAMHHEELKEIGITSVGHRLTILKAVYNMKIKQNIVIEPDDYVPPSAEANAPDAHATQNDIKRIVNQIKLRDERLHATEIELRALKEDLNRVLDESRRLREDVLPAIRLVKDKSAPLPGKPDGAPNDPLPSPLGLVQPMHIVQPPTESKLSSSISRKLSTKKFFLGSSNAKIPSPTTIYEAPGLESPTHLFANSHLTTSNAANSQPSPMMSQHPSPTSPPYNMTHATSSRTAGRSGGASHRHAISEEPWTYSNTSTVVSERDSTPPALSVPPRRAPTAPPNLSSTSTSLAPPLDDRHHDASNEIMKSFRVSDEDPCSSVLPAALRKYQINEDWRQYSLYIVHGDQERCLGLDERPLSLFKQLASEGKRPMFMLRRHATPAEGFARSRAVDAPNTSGGAGGSGGGGGSAGAALSAPSYAPRVQSYIGPGAMQLPGGVL